MGIIQMERKYEINVTLKKSVLDPQGQVIKEASHSLGFADVSDVRVGKSIELKLETALDADAARKQVAQLCDKLLANPVIEDFRITEID